MAANGSLLQEKALAECALAQIPAYARYAYMYVYLGIPKCPYDTESGTRASVLACFLRSNHMIRASRPNYNLAPAV